MVEKRFASAQFQCLLVATQHVTDTGTVVRYILGNWFVFESASPLRRTQASNINICTCFLHPIVDFYLLIFVNRPSIRSSGVQYVQIGVYIELEHELVFNCRLLICVYASMHTNTRTYVHTSYIYRLVHLIRHGLSIQKCRIF